MPSPRDLLTLTRQDLYELVWSKPMADLAKDFGLSDVALAKRCRKLGVPVPGRGYWARVAAGQTPRQPPLKKREDQYGDHSALSFNAPQKPTEGKNAQPMGTAEEIALRERIVVLQPVPGPDHNPSSPAVKRTAVILKRPWRRDITWNRGEKAGPVIRINTSDLVVDRALRFADRLVTGASMLEWPFQPAPAPEEPRTRYNYQYTPPPPPPAYGHFLVRGESLPFKIDERNRQVDYVLTEEEKEDQRRGRRIFPPQWDLVPSGELRLHLLSADSSHTVKTWKDSAKRPLEEQINTILLGFLEETQRIKERREERLRMEAETRRQEQLRLRLSQRRSANAKLVHQLEAQAGAWLRARLLRAYLRALKRALGGQKIQTPLEEQPIDFLKWADHYVEQLDPLSATLHDSDLMDGNFSPYGSDDGIRQTLSRLMGRNWQEAWKFSAIPDAPKDTDKP